jgi:hypothetical protein
VPPPEVCVGGGSRVFVAVNGRAFRIVDTDAEVEVAGMVLFDAIWTVEPLEESRT